MDFQLCQPYHDTPGKHPSHSESSKISIFQENAEKILIFNVPYSVGIDM